MGKFEHLTSIPQKISFFYKGYSIYLLSLHHRDFHVCIRTKPIGFSIAFRACLSVLFLAWCIMSPVSTKARSTTTQMWMRLSLAWLGSKVRYERGSWHRYERSKDASIRGSTRSKDASIAAPGLTTNGAFLLTNKKLRSGAPQSTRSETARDAVRVFARCQADRTRKGEEKDGKEVMIVGKDTVMVRKRYDRQSWQI